MMFNLEVQSTGYHSPEPRLICKVRRSHNLQHCPVPLVHWCLLVWKRTVFCEVVDTKHQDKSVPSGDEEESKQQEAKPPMCVERNEQGIEQEERFGNEERNLVCSSNVEEVNMSITFIDNRFEVTDEPLEVGEGDEEPDVDVLVSHVWPPWLIRIQPDKRKTTISIRVISKRIKFALYIPSVITVVAVGVVTYIVLMQPNDTAASHVVHEMSSESGEERRGRISSMVAIMHDVDSQLTVKNTEEYSSKGVSIVDVEVVGKEPEGEQEDGFGIHGVCISCEMLFFDALLNPLLHCTVEF